MNRYVVANYHYIRRTPGINGCTPEKFLEQVDYLSSQYKMVSLGELYSASREEKEGEWCSLTFDDGLREHHDIAYPELKKRGIVGAFFPIGMTTVERRVPMTHKLHILFSRFSSREIVDALNDFLGDGKKIEEIVLLNPKRRFDDILTANLKETLIGMPIKEREEFIDSRFQELKYPEEEASLDFFLSKENIRKMSDGGMEIGSHTYNHLTLDVVDGAVQKKDIEDGVRAMKEITGREAPLFAYPNGRFNEETLRVLPEIGITHAVILGARDISTNDPPLLIPRFDTNDVMIKI